MQEVNYIGRAIAIPQHEDDLSGLDGWSNVTNVGKICPLCKQW